MEGAVPPFQTVLLLVSPICPAIRRIGRGATSAREFAPHAGPRRRRCSAEGQGRTFQSLGNGACGYLLKNTPPARLLEALA